MIFYSFFLYLHFIDKPESKIYYILMLPEKMDKSNIIIAKKEELDRCDTDYWNHATITEKLETITFLRECFYGEEATTGRLQRVHKLLKLK